MVDFSPVFSKIDQNKERSNRRSFLWNSIFWNIHEKEGNKCRMSVNPSRMESYQCFTHKLREMRVNVKSVFVEGWLEEHVLRLVTRRMIWGGSGYPTSAATSDSQSIPRSSRKPSHWELAHLRCGCHLHHHMLLLSPKFEMCGQIAFLMS